MSILALQVAQGTRFDATADGSGAASPTVAPGSGPTAPGGAGAPPVIARLRGALLELAGTTAVVDVAGVGYEVEVTTTAAADLAASPEVDLHTHMIAREDAQALYGFANAAERDLFRDLIRVSGIGPKLAVALLSTVSPAEFAAAVANGNAAAITRVPGVGKRTAERLVVELKDKVDALRAAGVDGDGEARRPAREAAEALVALGYRESEAAQAVAAAQDASGEAGAPDNAQTVEELVAAALRRMASP